MIDFEDYIESLLEGYRSNYDIERTDGSEDGLYAAAHMHMEQVQNFILKEIRMSSADVDEYVYFYRTPHLTVDTAKNIINSVYEEGYPRIKLDHYNFSHQHMVTRLVVIFICDEIDEEAQRVIRRSHIYRNFKFALKGWMEVHTAFVRLSDGYSESNRLGRETGRYLKMHAAHYLKQHTDI